MLRAVAFPFFIPLGPLRMHPHFFFEALAYALGFRLYLWLRRRWGDPIDEGTRLAVVTGAALGAALGAKLLFLLQDPLWSWAQRGDLLALAGGKTIVGGLLGGHAGVEIAKRLVGERRSTGDLFVLPLCLGMLLGRVGCFLSGLEDHTHGLPTTLPWGVDFGDGWRRHPTQLYELVFLGLVAGWAWRRRRRLARRGDLFRGFMALYLAFRLLLDFLKPGARVYAGLQGLQVACLLGLVYHAPHLRRVFFRAAERPDD